MWRTPKKEEKRKIVYSAAPLRNGASGLFTWIRRNPAAVQDIQPKSMDAAASLQLLLSKVFAETLLSEFASPGGFPISKNWQRSEVPLATVVRFLYSLPIKFNITNYLERDVC